MKRHLRPGWIRVFLLVCAIWIGGAARAEAASLTWVEPKSPADLVTIKSVIEARGGRVLTLAPEGRLLVTHPGLDAKAVKSIPGVRAAEVPAEHPSPAQPRGRGMGLRRATPEQQAKLGVQPAPISAIAPNDLSRQRALLQGLESVPRAVDNSLSIYFPPVRSQGSQNSCAAWASTYYYETYTQAMDEGLNVAGGDNSRICSPAFIYNLINGGVDGGSSLPEAMSRLGLNGAASLALMPYDSGNCTAWPTEAAWTDALSRRTKKTCSIGNSSGATDADLDAIKQLLANGHIVVTSADVYENLHDDYPANTGGINNGVLFDDSGSLVGGHALTVVGYDDDKSYSDGSGTRYGAFLIVNSWGSDWGVSNTAATSKGFMWVGYDYFKSTPGSFGQVYDTIDRPHYRSKLYAAVGINSSRRGYIRLCGGIDAPTSPTWVSDIAINNNGGASAGITEDKRVVVDLNDGIDYVTYPAVDVFARMTVNAQGVNSAIASTTFFHDLDGDGVYQSANSLDPVVSALAGQTVDATARFTAANNHINRFSFSTIATPQTSWQPITVTATARDAMNQPASTFTATAAIRGCVETTTTVGAGTNAWPNLLAADYYRARWQSIYLQGELGGATTWTAVVLNVADLPGQTLENLTIRMKHTTLVKYGSSPEWESGWTTVYQHDKSITTAGPARFDFDLPFAYNGSSNVMLDFSFDDTRSTWPGSLRYFSAATTRTILYRDSLFYAAPTNWTATTPPPTGSPNVPDILLISGRSVPLAPTVTGNFSSGAWTGPIAVTSATSGMFLVANDGAGHTGRSNWFNVQEGPPAGMLTVNIGPAGAVSAGAQWRRANTSTWLATGATESGIAPGSYTVEFAAVPGWNVPSPQPVTITAAQTATISATYTQMSLVWVDYGYGGAEFGTTAQPYWLLSRAVSAVLPGGTIRVKSGTSNETLRITKQVRLESSGGPAVIGRE